MDGQLIIANNEPPIPGENYAIMQGALEKSNVNSIKVTQQMIEAQRDFDGISNIIFLNEQRERNMLNRIGSED